MAKKLSILGSEVEMHGVFPHQKWDGLEKMNSKYWANCEDTKFQLVYISQPLISPSVREKKQKMLLLSISKKR